ncbi:MAG: ATP-binding protein [Pacificibacter sp.]
MNIWVFIFGAKRSLKRGLLLNIIAALSLCVVLASLILISEFKEHLAENLEQSLLDEATEVLGRIDPSLADFGLDGNALRFRGAEGNFRYTVFASDGIPIAGSETSDQIWSQLEQLNLGASNLIALEGDRFALGLRTMLLEQDIYILVSTFPKWNDSTQLSRLKHEITEGFWWLVLGGVTVVAAALFATRSSLGPLRGLAEQAREIGPNSANRRLQIATIPTEFKPLIEDVNNAFDRLEQGYKAQRDFSSNVAHEIRTPIAVLKSSIDRISDPQLKATLVQDAEQLDRIFGQLIDLARSEAASSSFFKPVDLHALAVETAMTFAVEAVRQEHSLSVTGAQNATLNGNAGLLSIALSNLIRNALQNTPQHSEVEVEVMSNPVGWRILDRGTGVPDNLKIALFERFNRGAQAHSNGTGSGIGLAIVKSVADCHGASVTIEDREGGGSIFSFIAKDRFSKSDKLS